MRSKGAQKVPDLPPEITAKAVIRRMKEYLRVKTDAELAARLGVGKTTISSWRQRKAVPFEECIRVAIWERGNLQWLLTGGSIDEMQPGLWEGPVHPELLQLILENFERFAGDGFRKDANLKF
ncbi:MAG: helix-turn-helix domain-containing protein, partial [Rhodospirillales bacterium]